MCWYRNICGNDPNLNSERDKSLMIFIRRENLDILWESSAGTVTVNNGNISKGVGLCKALGVEPPYPPLGPYPVGDNMGFVVAIQMLKSSLLPGKYHDTHQQFDTIRGLRTAYSNLYESTWKGCQDRQVLRGDNGIALSVSQCPTQSLFFEKFAKGLMGRMGREVKSNAGL